MFDIPLNFVLAQGPDNATLTTSVLIYKLGFSGTYRTAVASAMSMIMFVVIVICSALLFMALRDKEAVAQAKLVKKEAKARKLALKEQAKGAVNE